MVIRENMNYIRARGVPRLPATARHKANMRAHKSREPQLVSVGKEHNTGTFIKRGD